MAQYNPQRNVETASRAKNPLESIHGAFTYETPPGGVESKAYSLYCRCKKDLDAKILKWAFKLAELNVAPFYRRLSVGWKPKVKQSDLNKSWARYLVALDSNNIPVGYAMFRFDMDYGQGVLYCYELQLDPSVQRQGLGKFMMSTLEKCASFWNMEKVILTVLINNDGARTFFRAIGYTLDHTTPDVLERADYEILSKSVPPRLIKI
uniref:N-alpha-acetyltransferase 40 n=1 Tax=Glossina austeni TaxID=7395 RepID=A0A1A9VYD0_GLOAU